MDEQVEDSPPSGRQSERRRQAEHHLLRAAAELIGETGPARVTLSDIGERAGYSRGLASHHFGSKGALIQRIFDAAAENLVTEFTQQSSELGTLRCLKETVSVYFEELRRDNAFVRAHVALWADAAAAGSEDFRRRAIAAEKPFRLAIATLVHHGINTGELAQDLDPAGFTSVLIGMMRGVAVQYMLDPDFDLAASQAEALKFVSRRLDEPCENEKTGGDRVQPSPGG